MTSTERLNAALTRLSDRGGVDFKPFLDPGAAELPRETVENGIAEMLEQYLDGKYRPAKPLNDLPTEQ